VLRRRNRRLTARLLGAVLAGALDHVEHQPRVVAKRRELVGVEQSDHLAEKAFVCGIEGRERLLAFLGQLHMTHASVRIVLHAGDQALGSEPVDKAAGRRCGCAERLGQLVDGRAFGL